MTIEYVELTRAEFDMHLRAWGEYSRSLPSGTTVGKKWFCNRDLDRVGSEASIAYAEHVMADVFMDWWLCEYTEHPDPKLIAISYKKVRIIPTK
jgi:hypothetical protein